MQIGSIMEQREAQQNTYGLTFAAKQDPSPEGGDSPLRARIRGLVESSSFSAFIIAVIALDAVIIGIQTMPLSAPVANVLAVIDAACLAIYVIEAAMKIYAWRGGYFRDPWNIFDFAIVVLSVVPLSMLPVPPQVARVLRIPRAFRVFRFVAAFRQMRIVVEAVGRSIPGIGWTAVLLLLIFYVYAVIGTSLFGGQFPELFGDLGASFYTLFQVMTLEGWSDGVARPVMAVFPFAWVYFITFIVVAAFIVLNVVVGIVVNTIDETCHNVRRQEMADAGDTLEQELAVLREQLDRVESLLKEDGRLG